MPVISNILKDDRRFGSAIQRHLLFVVVFIMIGSAILGAVRLRELSYWYDEVISIDSITNYTATAIRYPEQMPAYFIALRGWVDLVGESEVAGRWFSLLCGVLTLAFTYRIARQFASGQIAVFSIMILATSAFFVRYYREMRPYAFLACFATASTFFYLRWLAKRDWRDGTLYVITAAIMVYTHFYAGLMILAQAMYFLWTSHPINFSFKPRLALTVDRMFWQTVGLHAITGAILLPYIPAYLAGLHEVTNNGRYQEALTPAQAISTVTQALTNDNLGLFLLFGLAAFWMHSRLRSIALFWLVIPLGIVLFVHSFIIQTLTNPRYLIFVWPAATILFGLGVSALAPPLKRLTIPIIIFIGVGQVINNLPAHFPGVLIDQPWRDVFEIIDRYGKTSDAVLVNYSNPIGLTGYTEPIQFYSNRYHVAPPSPIFLDAAAGIPPLSDILTHATGAWILVTDGEMTPSGQSAVRQLQQMNFAPCQHWTYNTAENANTTLAWWQPIIGPYISFGQQFDLQNTPLNLIPNMVHPGQEITINLGWKIIQKPKINYSVAIHLIDQAGHLVAQQDGPLAGAQTSTLQPGQFFCDTHSLVAPRQAGQYWIEIIGYDSQSGQRLAVPSSAAIPLKVKDNILTWLSIVVQP